MRLRVAAFGTLGLAATGFGVGLLVAPDLLLDVGPVEEGVTALAEADRSRLILGASLVSVLYVALAARSRPGGASGEISAADSQFAATITDRPEGVTADRRGIAAAGIELQVEAAAQSGGTELGELRSTLRDTAVGVYASVTETDSETARALIERGEWTEDTVASAFLAGANGQTSSVVARLRLWLIPERERRHRIERTIAAIEHLRDRR
jgi:hypothetical protein